MEEREYSNISSDNYMGELIKIVGNKFINDNVYKIADESQKCFQYEFDRTFKFPTEVAPPVVKENVISYDVYYDFYDNRYNKIITFTIITNKKQ